MPDDRSTPARIRDAALTLFAQNGPDKVTVQRIAEAAGVSPGLVIHHFGSKDGLRHRVDEYVGGVFDELFASVESAPPTDDLGGSFADAILAGLPPGSPVPAYLRRLWLSGDEGGRRLFRRWFEAGAAWMTRLEAAGVVRPSADPPVRAAVLMVNDLAALLFREHLTDVLGIDLATHDGMRRWATEAVALYRGGMFPDDRA
ncbi:TetR/AcrR family transcriptional regulator [Stackebrandtia albiflava]|nr:TetR/AcrR family transcriptional regulator [Stackebrandtia albiflava]